MLKNLPIDIIIYNVLDYLDDQELKYFVISLSHKIKDYDYRNLSVIDKNKQINLNHVNNLVRKRFFKNHLSKIIKFMIKGIKLEKNIPAIKILKRSYIILTSCRLEVYKRNNYKNMNGCTLCAFERQNSGNGGIWGPRTYDILSRNFHLNKEFLYNQRKKNEINKNRFWKKLKKFINKIFK